MDKPFYEIGTDVTRKDAEEQLRLELKDLFGPARQMFGESLKKQLTENRILCETVRQRLKKYGSRRFPSISFMLSILDESGKDEFFKSAGDYFLPSPGQRDVSVEYSRLMRLRSLLRRQFEFETRHPAAYETLFPECVRTTDRAGLYLPSFDIHVLGNYPRSMTSIHRHPSEEVDSWSSTYEQFTDSSRVERSVWPVRLADLQGLLLSILSREEFNDGIAPVHRRNTSFDSSGEIETTFCRSRVRITDLRLAETLDVDKLKNELPSFLQFLNRPVGVENVIQWKRDLLGDDSEIYRAFTQSVGEKIEESSEDASKKSVIVSFTSAALFLFVDLETRNIQNMNSYALATKVCHLVQIIQRLIQVLQRSTKELEALTAGRSAGRQPHLKGEDYWALKNYRMGYDLRYLAEVRGIKPYDSQEFKGTRSWKEEVRKVIRRGKELENERLPRAATIFSLADHPSIRRKACKVYRSYIRTAGYNVGYEDWKFLADEIRVGAVYTRRGHEIISAYLQLGSCIEQGISPLP